MEDERVLTLDDAVFAALAGGSDLLRCVFWPGEEGVSVGGGEEEEGLLTLAEDEGLVGDLVGSDESVDFFGDTELELEESLVDLDEEDDKEDELLEFLEDLVEVCWLLDDTSELCLRLLALEEDEEELWGLGLVSSTSSPTSSTVTKSSMLKFCSSKRKASEETVSSVKSSWAWMEIKEEINHWNNECVS